MGDNPFDADERWAIGLYAVAARDFCDFLDFLMDPVRTNKRSLEILLEMVTREDNPRLSASDLALNQLMRGPVRAQLARRTS